MCTSLARIHTRAALFAAGMSRRRLEQSLRSGSLVRVRQGVYADAETCDVARRAALLGGPPACVSAARHEGLWVLARAEPLHVALRPHGHRRPGDAVVHWDQAAQDALEPPSVRETLRQILRCCDVEEFLVALESALYQRRLRHADLVWLEANTNAVGREAIAFARADAESGLETLVRWRLRTWGVPVRTQQRLTSVGRVDLLLGERLIVEVDGVENHESPERRHRDLLRDANAAAWGFITLRFDYAMVIHDWPTVELALRGLVDRRLHLAER